MKKILSFLTVTLAAGVFVGCSAFGKKNVLQPPSDYLAGVDIPYGQVADKPSIEGVELTGNKTADELGLLKFEDLGLIELEGVPGPQGAAGPQGIQGPKGEKGDKGDKGDTGVKGADGVMTFADLTTEQVESLRGETGATGETGPQGEKGDRGDKGEKGADGVMTFADLTSEQVESLRGETGERGADGLPGANGNSAYQVALLNGYVGTETAWLDSLIGPQGPEGPIGPKGEKGATGEKGEKGDTGEGGGASSWNDLTDKPDLGVYMTEEEYQNATVGFTPIGAFAAHTDDYENPHRVNKLHLGLNNIDNTKDIDKPISTATQTALNAKANTASLAAVATSGKYSDLTGAPTVPALPTLAAVATSGKYSDLTGTPALKTVATSGSYNDLTNKPTIPALPTLAKVATSGKYSDLTGAPALKTVATSGSYADLTNKPTIPADTNTTYNTATSAAGTGVTGSTTPTFTGTAGNTGSAGAGTAATIYGVTSTSGNVVKTVSQSAFGKTSASPNAHTHTVTPAGTVEVTNTSTNSGSATPTFKGSALATHTHNVTPTVTSKNTGNKQPGFTGTAGSTGTAATAAKYLWAVHYSAGYISKGTGTEDSPYISHAVLSFLVPGTSNTVAPTDAQMGTYFFRNGATRGTTVLGGAGQADGYSAGYGTLTPLYVQAVGTTNGTGYPVVNLISSVTYTDASYITRTNGLVLGPGGDFVRNTGMDTWLGTVDDYLFDHYHGFTPAGTVADHSHTYDRVDTAATATSGVSAGTPAGTVSGHTHTYDKATDAEFTGSSSTTAANSGTAVSAYTSGGAVSSTNEAIKSYSVNSATAHTHTVTPAGTVSGHTHTGPSHTHNITEAA